MKSSIDTNALILHAGLRAIESLPPWSKIMLVVVACVEVWQMSKPRRHRRNW
jgi:hypothetical protein